MLRVASCTLAIFAIAILLPGTGNAQGNQAPKFVSTVVPSALPDASESLPPLKDPATIEQIREYLRLSGDLDAYKARWIAAVDKNRSIGAPYWPESFWTSLKEEMQKTDLMPMYVVLYRHSIKRGLMQEVLDAYQRLGAERFRGSPECFKLGEALTGSNADMDKLTLAKTREVTMKVYAIYKPQIKAARARYLVEHPGWIDR
ncbi:MAG: hypothetical protein ABSE55_00845 [Terracidiphilus sp.]|jgi:hypothetical protein